MFILDTNVVSELMRSAPNPAIASWVAERATSSLFQTAVTEAELRFGLAVMPLRRRRDGLATGLERMLKTGFANRVLPFDSGAARAYARTAAACRRGAGRLRKPIARSQRLPKHAAWRLRRATFGTSRTWESKYSTHGMAYEHNAKPEKLVGGVIETKLGELYEKVPDYPSASKKPGPRSSGTSL